MPRTNEAFSRVKIDAQLKDRDWDVLNPNAVRFDYVLPDKIKADCVLCDRHGRALALIEAEAMAVTRLVPRGSGLRERSTSD
jgi:type I restriction enzyme, R subunit